MHRVWIAHWHITYYISDSRKWIPTVSDCVKMIRNYSFGGESTQSCWQQCKSWWIRTYRSHGLQCIIFDPVEREASEAALAGGYRADKITHLGGLTTSQGLHWKFLARADFNHEAIGVVEKNLVNFNAAFTDCVFDVFDAMITQCLLHLYYWVALPQTPQITW